MSISVAFVEHGLEAPALAQVSLNLADLEHGQ